MAVDGQKLTTSAIAAEDLSSVGQYRAFAFADRKLANSGDEACGIIQNKPQSAEHVTVAYAGEIKFIAGGAVAAGARVTVATSGYFTAAASGDYIVGRNGPDAVTSGSIGRGFFNFATVNYQQTSN